MYTEPQKNEPLSSAPPFSRQPPPPRLGVVRTILVVLMILILWVEILFLGGAYLVYSILPSSNIGGVPGSSWNSQSGQALPVNGVPVQNPAQ
ncbi:hypothetical protein D7X94_08485 [Acutalibacter sp. 1XD8-33]|uniref:hypothetical protein n=1 Tax=Acutalibacter sp. 1XD8-33 TaxID=2320081 RepID=UPI000EA1AF2D|nr:hypothetical protein [Acutalibacter sp. 1XD8-33]RKJ40372.1 hypothetical protein D7X94_08485 [Acutalibacter sp. 1XD8-33]